MTDNGVISATSGIRLKELSYKIHKVNWNDRTRYMFLIGLLEGALLQFEKDVATESLKSFINI